MNIIVDAMGGDYAPKEIVAGALKAAEELDLDITLVGREELIKPHIAATSRGNITIVNANEIISNDEAPVTAIRRKKDSSIAIGLKLCKEKKGDAFVSAGSTGALMAGGLFIMGRISNIDRPAIAIIVPTKNMPCLLLDVGANSEVKPKNLVQFAWMGSEYAKVIFNIENPRVGLLNIGVEEEKGTSTVKAAYESLKMDSAINFVGNIEARAFFDGIAEVVVCDGFTGNIFLKIIEGFGSFIFDELKKQARSKLTYTLGAGLLKPAFKEIKSKFDYSEYGGAMFLGIDGTLIKCHGSSDRKAIFNGIKAAKIFANSQIHTKLAQSLTINPEGE